MKNNYCVIMAGGIGSRFWPMSRTSLPKQFIDILGTGQTLLQQTFARLEKVCPPENILIVTHQDYRGLVLEQLPACKANNVLCEPMRRNTAPCIAYASFKIAQLNPNASMVVAPADHLILDEASFIASIEQALTVSRLEDCLITLGIKPSHPDTGYGYIEFNHATAKTDADIKAVKTFTEKPDLALAEDFVASGDFLWNAGIFVWSIASIMRALQVHQAEIYQGFEQIKADLHTEKEIATIQKLYPACANESIDYGVLEKATNVFVLPADFGWSDLGTWGSVYNHLDKDAQQNASQGEHVLLYNANGNMVYTPKGKLVVLQGIDDCIVVDQGNALLICRKDNEQQIKQFVNDIKHDIGDDFV